jgi:hypothetical protein
LSLKPQQAIAPLVRTAQLWAELELAATKVPAGSTVWPAWLRPQQATVPLVRTPHEWKLPALTDLNVPAGGVACPSALAPQQARVPFVLSPQEWLLVDPPALPPALTAVKSPDGGDD